MIIRWMNDLIIRHSFKKFSIVVSEFKFTYFLSLNIVYSVIRKKKTYRLSMVSKRPCSVVDIIKFAQRYWKQILKLQKFYQISQTRTIISVQRLANVNRCTNLFTIQTKTIRFNGNWARQFIDHRVIGYSANASSVFTPFVMFFPRFLSDRFLKKGSFAFPRMTCACWKWKLSYVGHDDC